MTWRVAAAGSVLALGLTVLLTGGAVACQANAEKLASLRRGMSYDETAQVMGCLGKVVTQSSPDSGDYAIVEWDGPGSMLFTRTRIGFLDGKLLSFTTDKRGAL